MLNADHCLLIYYFPNLLYHDLMHENKGETPSNQLVTTVMEQGPYLCNISRLAQQPILCPVLLYCSANNQHAEMDLIGKKFWTAMCCSRGTRASRRFSLKPGFPTWRQPSSLTTSPHCLLPPPSFWPPTAKATLYLNEGKKSGGWNRQPFNHCGRHRFNCRLRTIQRHRRR